MHSHNEPARHQRPGLTPIRLDEVYSLADFKRRTGLGKDGLRAARRKGLRICKCGRNHYVAGSDWFEFLSSTQTDSQAEA